jgi:hypothetical protein
MYCGVPTKLEITSTKVKQMAAGSTMVPTNSMKMTNCMEKQKVPHRLGTITSSSKLCTVELIQRRLCDRSTLNESGTVVWQTALGMKISFRLVNVFSISVVK